MSARLALQLGDRTGSPVIAPLPESGLRPRLQRGRWAGRRPGPAPAVGGYFPPPGLPPHAAGRGGPLVCRLCIAEQNSRRPPSSAALRPLSLRSAVQVRSARRRVIAV